MLIHPFDMPDLWEGHATVVHEIARDLPAAPGAVVVSVGGGGLLMGVLEGLKQVQTAATIPPHRAAGPRAPTLSGRGAGSPAPTRSAPSSLSQFLGPRL